MKKFCFIFCFAVVSVLLMGCSVVERYFPKKAGEQSPVAPVVEEKQFNGEPLVKALVECDAKKFLSLMPREIQEDYGEQGFKKSYDTMLQILGKPIEYKWLFDLEHPTYRVSIWKIRYERKSSDLTRVIHQESLFKVISTKINDKDVVLQFNFL